MNDRLKEIAQRVKELREIKGLTQSQMAKSTKVNESVYAQFEAGESDFGFTFIYDCAKIFGVEIKDLLEGESPNLSLYNVVRKGEGMPIERKTGFEYHHLAPSFKHKIAEPFLVKIPYIEGEASYSSHAGQEMDIVVSGRLKITINERTEILNPGDSIYYNSSAPHALSAMDNAPCEIYAIVMKGEEAIKETKKNVSVKKEERETVANNFITCETDDNGVLKKISFKNDDKFNFAFDCVDAIADKNPDKTAMVWVSGEGEEKIFTFSDMKKYSNKTANFLKSLGIKKGDTVMLVLKRHYQFWFTMLALHKIGAIAIPATNQLVEHDFDYRYKAAGVSAIVCTADGEVSLHAEKAAEKFDIKKIMVGGNKEGWVDFNAEMEGFSDVFEREDNSPSGDDTMLMLFTSGTTGYPRIAAHSYKYALGHYITAKYWHNVNSDGLHFTISDTGWGKALWGKLYGQWLSEAAIFTYDFERFKSEEILPMFKRYNITTFCAPPTMYRFFIKEDLSKYDLSSIEYATTAGEALNPEVSNRFKEATGLTIMEGFGQTETTLVIGNLVGTEPKVGSMGLPSPLYNVTLLDAEGKECAPGEAGEICISTKDGIPQGLYKGYYLDEAKTKEAWYDGYYHTGDQATRDEEGYFFYVGRIDDVIKSSGYRIGPFEIESVIMELPYVLECAITAVPDEIRGQIVKATIVLVKGKEGSDELKKEVQEYVKSRTAPYKYPRIVDFVSELPKTISGKVRRVEIRENDKKKA